MIKVRIDEDGSISKALRAVGTSRKGLYRMAPRLRERAMRIMSLAQDLCPVSEKGSGGHDPGFLRDSGVVIDPQYTEETVRVDMAFLARYAVYVHEDTTKKHKRGQAKFLEKAYLAEKRGTIEALEEEYKGMIRDMVAEAMILKLATKA